MSAIVRADGSAVAWPRLRTEALRCALLWLMGLSGAFVFIEPSPYEIVGLVTMSFFVLTGLALRPVLAPLVMLLVLLNIGYAMAVVQVVGETKPVIWVAISAFLATTAVFFAAMLGANTEARLNWLLRGTIAGAVVASACAIAGYFHAVGGISDLFLLYGRARGTFNDPNVLGAFLILPALLIFQRIVTARGVGLLSNGTLFLIMLAGLFMSFSRAAWGQFGFCALLVMALSFFTSRSTGERMRIVTIALGGLFVAALLIAVLLSIGKVAELFQERATLDQSYDLGHYGRFGRYILGAGLALDRPFGIGPLQFSQFLPEDPHNTFLNSFMSGGWVAGVSYLTLTIVTVGAGLRFVFVATPWRPAYQAIYVAYLGVAGESAIIDIDHWRHYFLILGVLWGLIAASQAHLRKPAAPEPRRAANPGAAAPG